MRVAMVTARFAPFTGGVETHVREVAGRLAGLGVDVTVLTTDPHGNLPEEDKLDGYPVWRFPCYPRKTDLHLSPGLTAALKNGRFDLVHVQGVHTLLAPFALRHAQREQIPTVLTFHTGGNSSPLRRGIRDLQWRAERRQIAAADRLVAVCKFEIERFSDLLRLPEERFALIRNGCERLPVASGPPPEQGEPLVLSIGRLERYKGHHRAIAALPDLLARHPAGRLVIVGSGPHEQSLRQQVAALGLEASVSFVSFGPDERDALGSLVSAADVVVLMSDYEAHPVAVMEALALGVDVVAADTSGLSELGREGLATVVDPKAPPSELANAIERAARERRWSAGAPQLPDWQECAAAILRTYEEVLGCAS